MLRNIILLAVVLGPIFCYPFVGGEGILSIRDLDDPNSTEFKIFWLLRMPRLLLGVLCGVAFGSSGLVFQTLFQNPLTTPYTLGIASGASLGAALMIVGGVSLSIFGVPAVTIGAASGAVFVTVLIFLLARLSVFHSKNVMLLTGVALSFFFSSLMLFLSYLADMNDSFRVVRWLMGGLDVVGFDAPIVVLIFVSIGVSSALYFSKEFDVLCTGEELALSRGVDVQRVRMLVFLSISLMIGGCVSFVGPIGFLGLVLPHVTKLLCHGSHKAQLLLCSLLSASFLVLCDLFARLIAYPAEIPIGVVTSLIGAPFFLWILLKSSEAKYA